MRTDVGSFLLNHLSENPLKYKTENLYYHYKHFKTSKKKSLHNTRNHLEIQIP